MRVRYYMKKPGPGRASFIIMRDVVSSVGRQSERVKDERIETVNEMYRKGLRDLTTAELEVRAIITSLYKRQVKEFNFHEDNEKLVKTYWEDEYAHRDLIDAESARNELTRAIQALGSTSILSAGKQELEQLVNAKYKGNKQRRIVGVLNRLLKYCNRTVALRPAKKERRKVKYLSLEEFGQVINQFETPYQEFYIACIATGGRKGEVFAFNLDNYRNNCIYIDSQVDSMGVSRETKTRRTRHSPILPFYEKQVMAWLELSYEEKVKIRNEKLSTRFKEVCKKTFQNKTKWCTVHDLRHSYAIHLVNRGVNLGLVAQSLGISYQVCQEHYSGFVLTPEGVQVINSILRRDGEIR